MPYHSIEDYQIYFESHGEGETILLIHGLGSSTEDWEKQIPYFSKQNKVVSVDLQGHGKTGSVKGAYSIKRFANDVFSLLSEDVKPVTIIGISMGGMIAFQLAVEHPEIVKNLVIINSFAETPMDNRKTRNAIRLRKLIPRILGMKQMGKVIGKKVFPKANQIELRKLMARRWAKNNTEDYIKSVNAIAGWTIKEHLCGITCPVLVVGSEFDYISTQLKEDYTKLIPNGKLVVIDDAYHAVTMEKPNELNALITDFLAGPFS